MRQHSMHNSECFHNSNKILEFRTIRAVAMIEKDKKNMTNKKLVTSIFKGSITFLS